MPPFFILKRVVSQTRARPADILNVKRALNRMGFYDVPDYGMTPYADRTMFDGIRRFQRANGLRVDGVMQRGHATERAMNDVLRLASAEKLEGAKLSLADAQRIKELEASGLYQLNCTPTTVLRGFRLGARRALVSCTTSGARRRPEASQRRPSGRFSRPLGASGRLSDGRPSPAPPLLPRKREKRS